MGVWDKLIERAHSIAPMDDSHLGEVYFGDGRRWFVANHPNDVGRGPYLVSENGALTGTPAVELWGWQQAIVLNPDEDYEYALCFLDDEDEPVALWDEGTFETLDDALDIVDQPDLEYEDWSGVDLWWVERRPVGEWEAF